MRWQFSIIQAFEVVLIVAITLAVDRLPNFLVSNDLPSVFTTIVLCGAATGTYLAYRWSQKRDSASIICYAALAAIFATAINASLFGGWAIKIFREENVHFSWSTDWPRLLFLIVGLAVGGAGAALVLSYIVETIRFVWGAKPHNQ